MEIKTYGVEGFMDWQCEIPVGRARATVHFTGGTITAYGITPAEYSTGDPVRQRIIETSDHFKKGRIKLLRKTGTPDPVKRRMETAKPARAVTLGQEPEETPKEEASQTTVEAEDGGELTAEAEEAVEVTPQEVAVSCLTDAQNYLRDNFGIATSKSRSKEKAQAFARENGIVFVGLE